MVSAQHPPHQVGSSLCTQGFIIDYLPLFDIYTLHFRQYKMHTYVCYFLKCFPLIGEIIDTDGSALFALVLYYLPFATRDILDDTIHIYSFSLIFEFPRMPGYYIIYHALSRRIIFQIYYHRMPSLDSDINFIYEYWKAKFWALISQFNYRFSDS